MGLCFIICALEFPHSIKLRIISVQTTFLLDFLLIPNPHSLSPMSTSWVSHLTKKKTISGSDLENLAYSRILLQKSKVKNQVPDKTLRTYPLPSFPSCVTAAVHPCLSISSCPDNKTEHKGNEEKSRQNRAGAGGDLLE